MATVSRSVLRAASRCCKTRVPAESGPGGSDRHGFGPFFVWLTCTARVASAQADFERCPWVRSAVTADLPYLGTWNSGRANSRNTHRSGTPYPWTGSSHSVLAWGMRWSSFYVAIRPGGRSKLGGFGPKWRPLGSGVLKAPGRLPKLLQDFGKLCSCAGHL